MHPAVILLLAMSAILLVIYFMMSPESLGTKLEKFLHQRRLANYVAVVTELEYLESVSKEGEFSEQILQLKKEAAVLKAGLKSHYYNLNTKSTRPPV